MKSNDDSKSAIWGTKDTPASEIIDLRSLYSPPEELAVLLEAHPNTRGAKIDVGYDYAKFARAIDNNRWARQVNKFEQTEQSRGQGVPLQSSTPPSGVPNAMEVLRRAREKRKMKQESMTPVAVTQTVNSGNTTPTPTLEGDQPSTSPEPDAQQRKRPKNKVTLSSGYDFLADVPVLTAPRTDGCLTVVQPSMMLNTGSSGARLGFHNWNPPRVLFSLVEDSDSDEVQVDENLQYAVSPVKASTDALQKYYQLISTPDSVYKTTNSPFVDESIHQCKHILIVGLNVDSPQVFKELEIIEQKRTFVPDHVGIVIVSGVLDCRNWMAPQFIAKHHSLGHIKFERPRDFGGKAAVDNKVHLLVFRFHKKLPDDVGITILGCAAEPFAELGAQMAQNGRSLLVKEYPPDLGREFFHQLHSRLVNKSKRLYQAQ